MSKKIIGKAGRLGNTNGKDFEKVIEKLIIERGYKYSEQPKFMRAGNKRFGKLDFKVEKEGKIYWVELKSIQPKGTKANELKFFGADIAMSDGIPTSDEVILVLGGCDPENEFLQLKIQAGRDLDKKLTKAGILQHKITYMTEKEFKEWL